MIPRPSAALTLALSFLLFAGCDRNDWNLPKTTQNQQQETARVKEKQDNALQVERDDYLKATRQELDQIRNEIDALMVKAQHSNTALTESLTKQTQDFEDELKTLDKKWQDVKDSSATAWKDMQNSLSDSIEKLKLAIHRASA